MHLIICPTLIDKIINIVALNLLGLFDSWGTFGQLIKLVRRKRLIVAQSRRRYFRPHIDTFYLFTCMSQFHMFWRTTLWVLKTAFILFDVLNIERILILLASRLRFIVVVSVIALRFLNYVIALPLVFACLFFLLLIFFFWVLIIFLHGFLKEVFVERVSPVLIDWCTFNFSCKLTLTPSCLAKHTIRWLRH